MDAEMAENLNADRKGRDADAAASTLRVTIVIEYPARPEHYPGCDGDPVKMAAYDQRSFDDGELDVVDLGEWKAVVIEPVPA
jgi:hypothetical protein